MSIGVAVTDHKIRESERGKLFGSYWASGCGEPPRVRRQNAYATFRGMLFTPTMVLSNSELVRPPAVNKRSLGKDGIRTGDTSGLPFFP